HRLEVAVSGTAALALLAWLVLSPPAPAWAGEALPFGLGPDGVEPLADLAPVSPGDTLCIKLRADEPAYVYALSVFGAEDPHQSVARVVWDPRDPRPEDETSRWGRLVAPGKLVACTQVKPTAAEGQHEGLLVFASPHPQSQLETWMDALWDVAERSPDQAV